MVDYGYYLAWALVTLADVMRAQDDPGGAQKRAVDALETSERVRGPTVAALSREVLGRLQAREAAARGSPRRSWSCRRGVPGAAGDRVFLECVESLKFADALADPGALRWCQVGNAGPYLQ